MISQDTKLHRVSDGLYKTAQGVCVSRELGGYLVYPPGHDVLFKTRGPYREFQSAKQVAESMSKKILSEHSDKSDEP